MTIITNRLLVLPETPRGPGLHETESRMQYTVFHWAVRQVSVDEYRD